MTYVTMVTMAQTLDLSGTNFEVNVNRRCHLIKSLTKKIMNHDHEVNLQYLMSLKDNS